ncbi:Autotransporter beta-domain superfamily protein [Candidatus Erwinia haradaeae]|uniref:Autotransporter beta-domain superfamily protein n=1 Tax=Candidatus Erwinia haradaeae TaxID=1922217 RepID=A0A451CZV3_9GAMM|nr:hypothetical protein [Candidatus Erwinia haradaeae]VFP78939.1 Autotransporter beta-domain superfamily protein [Candidatus Erwinia haradaeae]
MKNLKMKIIQMIIDIFNVQMSRLCLILFFFGTSVSVCAQIDEIEFVDKKMISKSISELDAARIYAISFDGSVIGGDTPPDSDFKKAAVWTGDHWANQIILGDLGYNHRTGAGVSASSKDGKILAGYAADKIGSRHGVIWYGDHWRKVYDVEKVSTGKRIVSEVSALSADGTVAGGHSSFRSGHIYATIWSGDHWSTAIDLDKNVSISEGSKVSALSYDGKVAGGYRLLPVKLINATIWFGDNWSVSKLLAKPQGGKLLPSEVFSLSSDGKIAAGYVTKPDGNKHASIWSGENWTTETDLGTFKSDNTGSSGVYSLSSDGKIAAGYATGINGKTHAAIWSGEKWDNKIDLGTLCQNDSGSSEISLLSPDGKIAVGDSIDDDDKNHAFILRVPRFALDKTPSSSLSTKPALNSVSDRTTPPVLIDLMNTRDSVHQVAGDAFVLMTLQKQSLAKLQKGCVVSDKNWCWLINSDKSNLMSQDMAPVVNLGYGITDMLSLGGVITNFFPHVPHNSHKINGNNFGIGFYADMHAPLGFGDNYFRPSFSFIENGLGVNRSSFSHTEQGKGNSKLNGFSSSMEWGNGQSIFNKNIAFFWHLGLRYDYLSRSSYQEDKKLSFPVKYNKINYENCRADVGVDLRILVSPYLTWISGMKIENIIKDSDLISDSMVNGIGALQNKMDIKKTQYILKTGVRSILNKNVSISFLTSLNQKNLGNETFKVTLGLTGKF